MHSLLAPLPNCGTEQAIFFIKDHFQRSLAQLLPLTRVTCPVVRGSEFRAAGQSERCGNSRPLSGNQLGDRHLEVVQSLAKWKRYALFRYGVPAGRHLLRHERPSPRRRRPRQRHPLGPRGPVGLGTGHSPRGLHPEATLRHTVARIYAAMRRTERAACRRFGMTPDLPRRITFVHSEDLCRQFPHLTPRQREDLACHQHRAIFLWNRRPPGSTAAFTTAGPRITTTGPLRPGTAGTV